VLKLYLFIVSSLLVVTSLTLAVAFHVSTFFVKVNPMALVTPNHMTVFMFLVSFVGTALFFKQKIISFLESVYHTP